MTTIPESNVSTPRWSVAALVQATPRGKLLWRAFEHSRTQVFVLTRAEQESFYGLERGTITTWQYSLALGALERATQARGSAWEALASFADEMGASTSVEGDCAPPPPVVLLHDAPHDAVVEQEYGSVGNAALGRDDARYDHLRDLDRDVKAEGR